MAKRNPIVHIKVTETVTRTAKIPVWKVHGSADEQLVRFNAALNKFEFAYDACSGWEDMEWNIWLGDDGDMTKAEIQDTLEKLLALIKAT